MAETADKAACGHADCAGGECPGCGTTPCCHHARNCPVLYPEYEEQAVVRAACDHPDFEALVIVTRLEDTGLFSADIKVWCKACSLPFEWPESIPMGLNLHGIARDLTGQELRVALRPATWPDAWSDRAIPPGQDGPRG